MATTNLVLTDHAIGVSEFKRNPGTALKEAGDAVAVLAHNRPVGYFVEPKLFALMRAALDRLEDIEDAQLAAERWVKERKKAVRVALDDL